MPHVASETRAHGLNFAPPSPARPGAADERAQSSAFESLLDDNAAAERPQPPAAAERPRAERAEPTREPAPRPDAKAKADGAVDKDRVAGDATDAPDKGDNAEGQTEPVAVSAEAAPSADAAKPVNSEPHVEGEVIAQPVPSVIPQAAQETGEGVTAGLPVKVAAKPVAEAGSDPAAESEAADDATGDGEALPDTAAATAGGSTDAVKTGAAHAAAAPAAATPQAPPQATTPAAAAQPAAETVSADAPGSAAPAQAAIAQAAAVKVNAIAGDKPAGGNAAADETALPAPEERGIQPATPEAARKADAQARGETPANPQRAAAPDLTVPPPSEAARAAPKADVMQAPSFIAPPQHTASAANSYAAAAVAQPALPMPQAAPVPLAGIAIDIAGKALAGKNHFEIRLDPPELGRIEVRLEIDREGRISSHLLADRRDTLDMLRRDSANLERALQDAGLKTSDNGLQFSLRDRSADAQPERTGGSGARIVIEDDTLPLIETAQSRYATRRGGIDIRI